MARARTTKKAAVVRRPRETTRETRKQESSSFFDYFRLTESYASLLLGIVVVIIAALLLVSFIRNKNIANFTNTNAKKEISATRTVNQQNQPSTPSTNQNLSTTNPGGTYTVQAGDDLWKIAEKTYHDGYKWTEIAKANNIANPSMISAGQKLTLPKVQTAVVQTTTPTPTTVQPTQVNTNANQNQQVPTTQRITGMTYTVVRGDYLWEIAIRAYGDGYKWVDIARANNLANPDIIHSGNVLKLPR